MKNLGRLPTELDKMEIDIALNPASDLQFNLNTLFVDAVQLGGPIYSATPLLPPQLVDTIDIDASQTKTVTLQVMGDVGGESIEDGTLRRLSIILYGNEPGVTSSTLEFNGMFNFVKPIYSEFGVPLTDLTVEGCETGETQFILAVPNTVSIQSETGQARSLVAGLNQRLNGEACIELVQPPRSESEQTTQQNLQSGKIDFYLRSYITAAEESASFLIFDLPFLFRDFDNVLNFQQGTGGELLKSAALSDNLQGLTFWNSAPRQLTLNSALLRPSDISGKKIVTVAQTSSLAAEQYQLLGAGSVLMAYSESYTALLTGVVDGTEYSWTAIDTALLDEVQTGFAELNVRTPGYMLFTSSERWAEVDPDLRVNVEAALIAESAALDEQIKLSASAAKQALISRGAIVNEIDDALHTEWVDSMTTLWTKYEDAIGVDLINQALSAR